MNRNWPLWRWLALTSILMGILLALFQPTLKGTANPRDFEWPAILFRFFSLAPMCFFGLALLVVLLKFARPLCRWLFTWRTLKMSLWGMAALMMLLALFYAEENWRGKRAWDNYRRAPEARGGQFDFASFIPPAVPEEQNFALTPIVASGYSRVMDRNGKQIKPENTNLVNRLNMGIYRTCSMLPIGTNLLFGSWQKGNLTDLKAWQDYYRQRFVTNDMMSEPPPMPGMPVPENWDANIYRNVAVALDTNEFSIAAQPQSPAADVLLALSKYDLDLEELRQASRLPYSRYPLDYTASDPSQFIFPHWAALKSCGLVLRLRATAELDDGQADKALADVQLILYLAGSLRREPSEYSFEQQMSLVNFAVQIIWEGLARQQWSEAQLAALEHDLAGMDAVQDYDFALRASLAANLRSLEYLRTERLKNSFTCMCGDVMWWPTLIYRLSPGGWFYLNERSTAKVFEAALPTPAELEQRILSPKIGERFEQALSQGRRARFIPDNMWLAFVPPLDRKAMNAARIQAGVDMARIACALERYRLAHGAYPENLDDLSPQFIEPIPHDIIDGQPLHYRRLEDGEFHLYSVGWDGQDDAGTPEDTRQMFHSPQPTGDWVWQYPAK